MTAVPSSLQPLQTLLKYVDQPNFVARLGQHVPWALGLGGAALVAKDVYDANPEERRNTLIKASAVMGFTIAGALGIKRWLDRPNLSVLKEGLEEVVIGFKYLKNTDALAPEAKALLQKASQQLDSNTFQVEDTLARHLSVEHFMATFKHLGVEVSENLQKLISSSKGGVLSVGEVGQVRQGLESLAQTPALKLAYQDMLGAYDDLLKQLEHHAKAGTMPNKQALLDRLESSSLTVFWPDRLKKIGHLLDNIHSPKDIASRLHTLKLENQDIPGKSLGQYLMHRVIPDPDNLTAPEILKEIGDLSLMGFAPVATGVLGGVVGNALTGENIHDKFKNQAKEAFFQFFANIVLCNIGAGAFLGAVEMAPRVIKTIPPGFSQNRLVRFWAMIGGIMATGVLGGSAIANFFGKNFVNRVFDHGLKDGFQELKTQVKEQGWSSLFKDLYAERRPGPLDVMLHADDIATVGVLSGLKWIEEILPMLYTLSGFRAGMGYRSHGHGSASDSQPKPHPRLATSLITLPALTAALPFALNTPIKRLANHPVPVTNAVKQLTPALAPIMYAQSPQSNVQVTPTASSYGVGMMTPQLYQGSTGLGIRNLGRDFMKYPGQQA
jgi:hypothetical protein